MQLELSQLTQASSPPIKYQFAAAPAPADTRSSKSAQSRRILIVEDDYFVSLELEHRLVSAGFEVTGIATSADEATQMAAVQKPELVVMDIRLVGRRDGVDAAIELREKYGIPAIFASAHVDAETRRRALPARPVGWLQKPYSSDSIVRLIKEALDSPHN
ncbi:MAG: response regulator [Methyloceanibacter sp.]|uniref:response regulator n=1 Tax=Methyloceanibacter sp. TaxID=1965321 RepID=UPI003D9B64F9